ncbi:ParB/RepB/Spo0J family partition protein [Conexibacter sp. W3-3-2]|uniref:ParB/RepB/Spo0J family partition protein n=1 Tax=Conexibacter sp. W3-3-2 TaxID=2675227 RepID=UPI0018AAFE43|nr:ParB/RepB/Spo0J family partition protein [Conexibacter sp. W3-3-2]
MASKKPAFPTIKQARAGQEGRTPAKTFAALSRSQRLQTVAIDKVAPNPRNPRTHFDPEKLQLLAESIAARGVLQPPVARHANADGIHILVAGERRLRAAKLAGLTELEIILVDGADDGAELADALMENVARQDLSPIEEARAYATLVEDLDITKDEAARRTGVSRSTVSNRIRLLDLPDTVLEYLDDGRLDFAHGRALLTIDDHDQRKRLARQAVELGWSKRTLENAANELSARPNRKRQTRKERADAADSQAAADTLVDALAVAGHNVAVKVTKKGVTITLPDLDAAHQLATAAGAKLPAD